MSPFLLANLRFAESDMLPCLSQQVLGIACPGCGFQRSVALALQGRLWESFLMYPGLLPMLGLFGFMALDRLFAFRNGSLIIRILAFLTVGAILSNFLIRLML